MREANSTVEQLEQLIQTRNVLLARLAPLSCISHVNGEIHSKAMETKNRVADFALEYLTGIAGSR